MIWVMAMMEIDRAIMVMTSYIQPKYQLKQSEITKLVDMVNNDKAMAAILTAFIWGYVNGHNATQQRHYRKGTPKKF